MITVTLNYIQIRDLIHYARAQEKRTKESGDRPYWRALAEHMENAVKSWEGSVTSQLLA